MRIDTEPRMSRAGFIEVLEFIEHTGEVGSPALPVAGECYDLVLAYGLDPTVALGFFRQESTCGLAGAAKWSRNWGNVRPPRTGWLQSYGLHDGVHYSGQSGSFLKFTRREGESEGREWLRSCEIWCILITELYIADWGRYTIRDILQKYLGSPGDDETVYEQNVRLWVEQWASEYPPIPPGPTLEERVSDLERRVKEIEEQLS